jgi:hypothetical protein
MLLDVSRTAIDVIRFERAGQIVEGEAIGQKLARLRGDHELSFVPADAVDFRDATYLSELRFDDPLHGIVQVVGIIRLPIGAAR